MIELPFPAKVLWPNGRTRNHKYRAAEFKRHKEWAFYATRETLPSCFNWNGVEIQLNYVITPKTRHSIDKDNCIAAMKAYQDGIALALSVDDSAFAVPTITFADPAKPGKVEVRLG